MGSQGTPNSSRIQRLREAVADAPDSAEAHYRLGSALLRVSLVDAQKSLRRAIEIDPKHVRAWVNLGGVLLSLFDFEGCVEANGQALACEPDLLQAHYNQGLGHMYLSQPEPMAACFRRVVELDSDHASGHYYLAAALLSCGDAEAARAAVGKALALGHSPQPEFLKALERQSRDQKAAGAVPEEDN